MPAPACLPAATVPEQSTQSDTWLLIAPPGFIPLWQLRQSVQLCPDGGRYSVHTNYWRRVLRGLCRLNVGAGKVLTFEKQRFIAC